MVRILPEDHDTHILRRNLVESTKHARRMRKDVLREICLSDLFSKLGKIWLREFLFKEFLPSGRYLYLLRLLIHMRYLGFTNTMKFEA